MRLKVEVVGPAGRRWLWLPAATPIVDLLPTLVPLVAEGGAAPDDRWALAPPVGRPLDSEASLGACGVRPGATLCLVSARLAEDADGVQQPHALVGMRTPQERTVAALPARLAGWPRVRAALRRAREDAPAPVPAPWAQEPGPNPARFARQQPASPWRRGWRAWRDLDYPARLETAVTTPRLRRTVTVAVVSPFAGAGATVVAGLLGTQMADLRRDRVIALDADPGPGSLISLVAPGLARYLDTLLGRPAGQDLTPSQLDASLAQGYHGLRVQSTPPDPELRVKLDEAAYGEIVHRLTTVAGLVVVDCGPGLETPAARAAMRAAQQVLVVTDARPEARLALGPAVDLARGDGRSVLVVASAPRARAGARDAGRLAVGAPAADGLVEVPWCPSGVEPLASGDFDWERTPWPLRRGALELAAAMIADWPRLGLSL
jgi:MinD-like ATPase involved in chromosome partitioning or flagellar assembly